MKSIKLTAFFMAVVCVFFNCKKGGDDGESNCEDNNTTQVKYTNSGTVPLRVVVATSLTPQFEPVYPVFTLDLGPGESIVKEFEADRYNNVWYTNCATSCSLASYNVATYAQCEEYEEERGL